MVTTPQDTGENTGNMIFVLAKRQDWIRKYLQKKIERLNHRLEALEQRGRP